MRIEEFCNMMDIKDIMIIVGIFMLGIGIYKIYNLWLSILIIGLIIFIIGIYGSIPINKKGK